MPNKIMNENQQNNSIFHCAVLYSNRNCGFFLKFLFFRFWSCILLIFFNMDCTTTVGYAWRYLEIQGKLNAMAQKTTPRQTFFIEPEEDEDSLLRFAKEVIPHKELIAPPQYVNQRQQLALQRSQNTRLCSDPLAMQTQIVRSSRQGADTEMTSNAFSNLDAIAQMGAGIDDHDAQQVSGQNTPVAGGNLSETNQIASSAQFQQNFEQRTAGGGGIGRLSLPMHRIGPSSQQQMISQISPVEQQQRLNMIYKQQQQKITSTTYRSTPQTGAEVFDFDEPTSFVSNIGSSPSYNSSTVVGGRRRGRGRRAGNMGDRQLSISSIENESSTPGSPSDYNLTRVGKRRAAGIPGQRKPRKLKRQEQEASNNFDNQLICQQQQQYQQNMITQQQSMMCDEFTTTYDNSAPIQEEVRSRLVSQYEMVYESSSSSDEEMDPPPPPRNLEEFKSFGNDMKVESGKSTQKTSISQHKTSISSVQKSSQINQQEQRNIQSELSETKTQTTLSEQTQILEDIKFSYASSSSSPSLTSIPQPYQSSTNSQADLIESRKNSKIKLEEIKEQEELKTLIEEKVNVKKKKNPILLDDLFDNQIDKIDGKKEPSEPTKSFKQLEANFSKSKNKEQNVKNMTKKQTTTEESTKKPGKIVLKIKPPREAQITTTKNSSSSSPSSTSSSISASNFAAQIIQMGDQPVARLSSSGAPPSKSKQQQNVQQQIRHSKKSPLESTQEERGTKQKKIRKSEESGGRNSPNTRPTTSSTTSALLKTSKSGKSNNKNNSGGQQSTTKELAPSAPSITTLPPFPSLKNFKIPKVIETPEPVPPSSKPESRSTAEKEGRKSSSTSFGVGSTICLNNSDNRRHGEKGGGGNHSKGGIWEKGNGSNSSSYSGSSHYNRQRQSSKSDRRDRDHSSSRAADNSRLKKNVNHPTDRSGGRGQILSRPPSYQQQPPPPQSPREHNSGAFHTQNWSQFNQQYMPQIYQGGQKPNWPPAQQMPQQQPRIQQQHGFEQTQSQQQIYQHQYRPKMISGDDNPTATLTQQQQRPTNNNQEEKSMEFIDDEGQNDNSPSGDGLQIVDEE